MQARKGNTKSSKSVYGYNIVTKAWEKISEMSTQPRSDCFAVTLPTNILMVVGGLSDGKTVLNSVEFADLV